MENLRSSEQFPEEESGGRTREIRVVNRKEKEPLRLEQLLICEKCSEPVMASAPSHECGELQSLIHERGKDSFLGKLLTPILEQARSRSEHGGQSVDVEVRVLDHQTSPEKMDIPPSE